MGSPGKSAEADHPITLNGTNILTKKPSRTGRIMGESIKIGFHLKNMNRKMGSTTADNGSLLLHSDGRKSSS
jgi:hypothetical protein